MVKHPLEASVKHDPPPEAVEDESCVRCSDPAVVRGGYQFSDGNASYWYCRSCYEFMDDVYTVDEVLEEYD